MKGNIRFRLTPELRTKLKNPLGILVQGEIPVPYLKLRDVMRDATAVVTVGDIVTENTLRVGVKPDLAIYDGRTKRKEHRFEPSNGREVCTVEIENPPGVITMNLMLAVRDALRAGRRTYIKVNGEEDLAAIPAVLYAPYGAVVVYGQPDEGVVLIRVTPECKRRCAKILASMEVVRDGS